MSGDRGAEHEEAERERVLVVSVDGLAPRVITPVTMPNLCALAGSGASCFQAHTVVPPITVPAHASMLRGTPPEIHGLTDNTPIPPTGPAPSFLAVARDAGRTTASVICWWPLDQLVEQRAVLHRVTLDSGYDPYDDVVVTYEVAALLRRHRPDVTFAYLVGTDLAGHVAGWGSDLYVEAAGRIDAELARLVHAAGPEMAIVVTTDHGGVDHDHHEPLADTIETFVVVRSRRIAPGSMWSSASILDIAPTVADLAAVAPAPEWTGRSLLGRQRPVVDHLLGLVAAMADHSYGERVDMLEHSLQAAACARAAGAGEALVLAALLHDVGHLLGEAGDWGLPDHAGLGARHLQQWLPAEVVEPIRLHVAAKRYLIATEREYLDQLSPASIESLRQQGGPYDAEEAAAFAASAHADAAVALRRFDDHGKIVGVDVRPVGHYRGLLTAAVDGTLADPRTSSKISAMWARDSCRCPECRHPQNGQHLIDVTDLVGWQVVSVEHQPDALVVTVADASGHGRSHRCVIPTGEPSGEGLATTRWDATHLTRLIERATAFDHAGTQLDRFACDLAEHGIALVTGLPTVPGTILDFAERVGFVRNTNYGPMFDVVADPNPINLAYTAVGLPLHTDNPYRDPVPTVQLLHCLRAAEGGGASMFSDGFHAAELLRTEHPDEFETLTTTAVAFRYADAQVDLRAVTPLIQLDAGGTVVRVTVNHRSMEPVAPSAQVDRFYSAYHRLATVLAEPGNAIELSLRPGDLIAFDNRRVLHGRRRYDHDPDRHLQGCYIDIDAVRSTARRAAQRNP